MIYGIVAVDQGQGIGFNNSLPWPKLKQDLKFFKEQTTNNIVIMGSKTWTSIGNPLPDRINVVISSTLMPKANFTFFDPEDAINSLKNRFEKKDIYIIGGEKLFNSIKHLIDVFYITEICEKYNCDRFFDLSYVKENFKNEEIIEEFNSTEITPKFIIKKYTK